MKNNEFSKWVDDYEKESNPAFNKRLIKGVIVPQNLDSDLLQHYITYKINKSNQQLVKVTITMAGITALVGLSSIIINLMIYFK